MNNKKSTMKTELNYSPGSLLVIWLTAGLHTYIAEVVQTEPLILKVVDEEYGGLLTKLKPGDYIIRQAQSWQIQENEDQQRELLSFCVKQGRPLLSGLRKLGCADGTIYEILPEKQAI